MYNEAIRLADEAKDAATRELLESIVKEEDGHVDWLEEAVGSNLANGRAIVSIYANPRVIPPRRSGKTCTRMPTLPSGGELTSGGDPVNTFDPFLYRPIRRRHADWRRSPATRPTPWTSRRPSRCPRWRPSRRRAELRYDDRAWSTLIDNSRSDAYSLAAEGSTTARATW